MVEGRAAAVRRGAGALCSDAGWLPCIRSSRCHPQGHALAIGGAELQRGVFSGLVGDRDALPDMDDLISDLEASLAEQVGATG
jgi:hypothetical protein